MDGAVATLDIVAGIGISPFVIVAHGIANAVADGFFVTAANHSGSKAERDNTCCWRD